MTQNTEFGYGGRQNGGHECHKAFSDVVYGIIAIRDGTLQELSCSTINNIIEQLNRLFAKA